MKIFHSLVAGLRPAHLILARWIAFALLFVGAGLVLVQPCAGAPFEFEETGSLATARDGHTATLLPNGKVLATGGFTGRRHGWLASAELYDPASGTWTATGSLATERSGHTATLVPNGKVLVAGGYNGNVFLASAELYDPALGDLDNNRQPRHRSPVSHGDVAAQRQGARRWRRWHQRVACERGTLRSGERDLGGHRQAGYCTPGAHGDLAA